MALHVNEILNENIILEATFNILFWNKEINILFWKTWHSLVHAKV